MADIVSMIQFFFLNLLPYLPWIGFLFLLFFIYVNSQSIYTRITKGYNIADVDSHPKSIENHNILVIVPTFNESKTIRQKIENMYSMKYPIDKFAIAIVDGASTDDTLQIASEIQNERENTQPKLYVVKQDSRTGKSDGILHCLSQIEYGDIILVTDANCRLNPDALEKAEREFRNPNVGGVTLSIQIPESSLSWVSESEKFYWNQMEKQRIQLSRKGLFFHFNGAFQMMRRDLATKALETSNFTFAEDMIGGIVAVLNGSRVVFLHDSSIIEHGITSVSDLMRQKKNRAIGLYDAIKIFRNYDSPFKMRYRNLVYLKTIVPLTSPIFLISLVILFGLTIPLTLFIPLLVLALVLALGISKFRYFVIVQIAILRALFSILTGRRGKFWEKTDSDRIWPD